MHEYKGDPVMMHFLHPYFFFLQYLVLNPFLSQHKDNLLSTTIRYGDLLDLPSGIGNPFIYFMHC